MREMREAHFHPQRTKEIVHSHQQEIKGGAHFHPQMNKEGGAVRFHHHLEIKIKEKQFQVPVQGRIKEDKAVHFHPPQEAINPQETLEVNHFHLHQKQVLR